MTKSQLKKIVLLYNVKMDELRSRPGRRLAKQIEAFEYALNKTS